MPESPIDWQMPPEATPNIAQPTPDKILTVFVGRFSEENSAAVIFFQIIGRLSNAAQMLQIVPNHAQIVYPNLPNLTRAVKIQTKNASHCHSGEHRALWDAGLRQCLSTLF